MKLQTHQQHALALISAVIVLGCILIIGGIAVKILVSLAKRLNPPSPPVGGSTNSTDNATSGNFAGITAPGVWYAPQLTFEPLPAPVGQTAANPFGNAHLEVERSTNLMDWETIAVFTNVPNVDLMSLDTNRAPSAFYRGKFVYP